jgi:hypothetical protein
MSLASLNASSPMRHIAARANLPSRSRLGRADFFAAAHGGPDRILTKLLFFCSIY